jgi:hypothetical protein
MKYRFNGIIYDANSRQEAIELIKKRKISEGFADNFVDFLNTPVEEEIKNIKKDMVEEYKIKYKELQNMANSFISDFSKKCNELCSLSEKTGN